MKQLKKNTYHWKGVNLQGDHLSGTHTTDNPIKLRAKLRAQGIHLQKLHKASSLSLFTIKTKIKKQTIVHFYFELGTLLDAGLTLSNSLKMLETQTTNSTLSTLCQKLTLQINTGNLLSDALSQYPQYFSKIDCQVIAIGEQSGSLRETLVYLATYHQQMNDLLTKIKKALWYPVVVLIMSVICVIVLLTLVLPRFASLFAEFSSNLPLLTRYVITLSHFMQTYCWPITVVASIALFTIKLCYSHAPKIRSAFQRCFIKIPFLGTLYQLILLHRCLACFITLYRANVTLPAILENLTQVVSHIPYQSAFINARHAIIKGESFSKALDHTKQFPAKFIQMLTLGEQSGTLDKMTTYLTTYYQTQLENLIASIKDRLEPLFMVFISTVVGAIIIAMYLPIMQLNAMM